MRIKRVEIANFRSFEHAVIEFDGYTALVGANGAGKSSVLYALNVFFREVDNAATNTSELDREDFHHLNVEESVQITVTFDNLSREAERVFADYFRQGELVISAVARFDESTNRAAVLQYGQRRGMDAFRSFFVALSDGAKVEELKAIYRQIQQDCDLPVPSTKEGMRQALRNYEEAHPELCVLIPSEDQFYGFSKGSNRLAPFVQWVYVPAVKDVTQEQTEAKNTALGRLLARTVRAAVRFDEELKSLRESTVAQYCALLESQQSALEGISRSLSARLAEWAHPDAKVRLAWQQDPKRSVQVEEPVARLFAGEADFEGALSRFGHGLQRSYLLALLQELAAGEDAAAPTLLLAIEEPELYQHPPQARHLAGVLQTLSEGNAQVIVSTHSPQFVSGRGFEAVRLVQRVPSKSIVKQARVSDVAASVAAARGEAQQAFSATLAKLNQILQPTLNELFFTPRLVLVEGLEDAAYVTSWMILGGHWTRFRRSGCHLVPVGGKSELVHPLAITSHLEIPTFVIFDADGADENTHRRAKHEADNRAILRLVGGDENNPFPDEPIWGDNYVVWPDRIGDALKADIGQSEWDRLHNQANAQFGNPRGFGKNAMHIGATLALFHEEGGCFPTLERLCRTIMTYAAS